MRAEDNITLFLLVAIVIVAVIGVGMAVVDKINHQKEEVQQPKQNEVLEMNNRKTETMKADISGGTMEYDNTYVGLDAKYSNTTLDSYTFVYRNCFRGTCKVCGRENVGLGFYGRHVLCDSCFEDFQEYVYQLWREHRSKEKRTK